MGAFAMVICILVMAQGFHSLEHLAQWIQYHILRWPSFVSSGSDLDAERRDGSLHLELGGLLTIAYLVRGGMRDRGAGVLMAWITAHALRA